MPNYQEGKIYKVYLTINQDIYIGSTIQKLTERMTGHRRSIWKNYPIYKEFREHGVENFFIELIGKCPCNDKDELRRTEGKYIRELKPALNMLIAGKTKKEYYEDNKDKLSIRSKEYATLHKEDIRQQQKQYRENHKEQLAQYQQEYWQKHKDEFKPSRQEYRKLKITCECGCVIARGCI